MVAILKNEQRVIRAALNYKKCQRTMAAKYAEYMNFQVSPYGRDEFRAGRLRLFKQQYDAAKLICETSASNLLYLIESGRDKVTAANRPAVAIRETVT